MNPNWHDAFLAIEHLTGFVIVMLALTLLWGLTALMAKLVARFGRPVPVAAAATAAIAPSSASEGLPDDDLVVIAAAVASMVEGEHRVVAVRPMPSSWGQQGRREIHASHRIR